MLETGSYFLSLHTYTDVWNQLLDESLFAPSGGVSYILYIEHVTAYRKRLICGNLCVIVCISTNFCLFTFWHLYKTEQAQFSLNFSTQLLNSLLSV